MPDVEQRALRRSSALRNDRTTRPATAAGPVARTPSTETKATIMFLPATLEEVSRRRREFESAAADARAIRTARTASSAPGCRRPAPDHIRRIATAGRVRRYAIARTRRAVSR